MTCFEVVVGRVHGATDKYHVLYDQIVSGLHKHALGRADASAKPGSIPVMVTLDQNKSYWQIG